MSLSEQLVFLWGHASDPALAAVYKSLCKLNANVAFFDHRRVLDTEFHLNVDQSIAGKLKVGNEEIDLENVRAAYIRPFDSRWLPKVQEFGPESAEWIHALNVEGALISWADFTPAFIINRPRFIASNTSKPQQAARIQKFGFDIPATLITTDPEAVHEFWETHKTLIYKSISATRSVISRLTSDRLADLQNITWCPTQFQQYIAGHDYRVHVVADEVFACEIRSTADDYRFAFAQNDKVELRAFDLPDDVADRCRKLAIGLGMAVAGIDLRCTPEGKWYCFEVNPVAGFAYYQEPCNHRIDDAIARLLVSGGSISSRPEDTVTKELLTSR